MTRVSDNNGATILSLRATKLEPSWVGRVPFVLFVTSFLLAGASACGKTKLEAELIPGTERIQYNDNGAWFSISPDERWIAFMEVDSVDWDPSVRLNRFPTFHLVTMDLRSHATTHHRVNGISSTLFQGGMPDPWFHVRDNLEAAGWSDSCLVVPLRSQGARIPWIMFSPGVPAAATSSPPATQDCLDCVNAQVVRHLRESFGLSTSVEVAVPFRERDVQERLYRVKGRKDAVTVERMTARTGNAVVFEESRPLCETHILRLGVSPNEEYVAYSLLTHLKSPIPLPRLAYEVFVRDMDGVASRIFDGVGTSGNFMWSRDSKRLYCAVVMGEVADGYGDGVYIVHFSHE